MHGFELLRKVAEGSAAEAFLARAPGAKYPVLVEVSRAEVLTDMDLYGRFLDRAMGRRLFHHPHLVGRASAGCGPDGRVFVATEAIDGPTIAERLARHGPYDLREAVRLIIPIAAALTYLHERDVIHGNLSPKNVYLTGPASCPQPKLLEMGLLLFRTNRSMRIPEGARLVAEAYLSPERAAGHRADVRSDVYGLGVLLYELLTGRPPYAFRGLHQTAPIPGLPSGAEPLAAFLTRCLAKDPAQRFQTAREAQLELEALPLERDALSTLDIQVLEPAPRPPPLVTVNQRGPGENNRVIVGSYEVLKPLGEGGMGRVFLARHLKLDRLVALKTLKAVYASDPLHLQRFVQEARAVNRVKHPHLVEIFDFLEEGPGRVCCVMEPLFGETLKDRAKRAPLPITRAVKIVRQACGALAAVHDAGVIHRDLKPDNLFLVDREGDADFVKVLDFGIAQIADEEGNQVEDRSGEVVGTPAYMAPEQTMPGPLDGRCDVYALGTVLYVLLQGRFPHDATQPEPLMAQKVTHKARGVGPTSASGEPIPQGLRAIVDRCLQRHPGQRFQTMNELSQALEIYELEASLLPQSLHSRAPMAIACAAAAMALGSAAWVWSLDDVPAAPRTFEAGNVTVRPPEPAAVAPGAWRLAEPDPQPPAKNKKRPTRSK